MSRILLIRPPSVFARSAYSAAVTMPLSIAYLAANLREKGHDVSVIDSVGEDVDHIAASFAPNVCYRGLSTEAIVRKVVRPPDGIGVSATFSQDWPHVERIINALHDRFPGVPIIVGGEHATAAGEFILHSCRAVSQVALGEGEGIVVDFADWLDGRTPIERISGILYRDADGVIRNSGRRERIRDPDSLPWPAWDLFDLEPYFETGEGNGVDRGRAMPILATRGCPYQCSFCSSAGMWTTRYTVRDVGRVVDEIEHYVRLYKIANIDFADLTPVMQRRWILDFSRELRRRKLGITWQLPNGTRAEPMDREVLSELAAAGCTNISFAPESGSESVLGDIKKDVSLPRMFEAIRTAKEEGIFVKCNLMIGFPHESRLDMVRTVRIAIRLGLLGVDDVGLFLFSPYPGTELFRHLQSIGRIGELDHRYFVSLMSVMDLGQSTNYCENVGAREIAFYRLFGMGLFYSMSYLLHPGRIPRSIRNYLGGRSDTLFEERLFGLFKRLRLEKGGRRRPCRPPARNPVTVSDSVKTVTDLSVPPVDRRTGCVKDSTSPSFSRNTTGV